jgi:hypothetical protein
VRFGECGRLLVSGARVATIFQFKSETPWGRRSMRLALGTDAALGNRPICIINLNSFNFGGRAHAPARLPLPSSMSRRPMSVHRGSGNARSGDKIGDTAYPMGFGRRVGYYLAIPKGVDRKENVAMAQKVIRQFVDDIDGSEAERTFSFAVDGTQYEIDLSSENILEFNDAIA